MHRKNFSFWILLLCPFLLKAQTIERGIRFEKDVIWQEVKEQAKRERKYIFVDCYATWCIPCKEMDKRVYTSEIVGKSTNANFISVKVQMDTTSSDANLIKQWYGVAHSFREDLKVGTFPTYLFFSPDGKIVHRESGFKKPEQFIKILADAVDPKRQVYTQLENYNQDSRDFQLMPVLAKNVYSLLGDKNLAYRIADNYKTNYLNKLSNDQLLKKENIEFISWYPKVLKSGDKYFRFIYDNLSKVDSVMNQPGFASKVVDNVIYLEEIYPKIFEDGSWIRQMPNWTRLLSTLSRKYSKERANSAVLDGQIDWYRSAKSWDMYIQYSVKKIEKNGLDTSSIGRLMLNNFCYDMIFKYSNDTVILKKAIGWMQTVLKFEPDDASTIDTYANLLYKVGNTAEAIKWQEIAVRIDPGNEHLKNALDKMKTSKPTWID